jgi:hypothetical protein
MGEEELRSEDEASQVVIVEQGDGLHDPGGWLAEDVEVMVLLEVSHW